RSSDLSDADPAAAVEAWPLSAGVRASPALSLERTHPTTAEPAAHEAGERVGASLAGLCPLRGERQYEGLVLLLGDDRLPLALGDHYALVLAQAGDPPGREDRR